MSELVQTEVRKKIHKKKNKYKNTDTNHKTKRNYWIFQENTFFVEFVPILVGSIYFRQCIFRKSCRWMKDVKWVGGCDFVGFGSLSHTWRIIHSGKSCEFSRFVGNVDTFGIHLSRPPISYQCIQLSLFYGGQLRLGLNFLRHTYIITFAGNPSTVGVKKALSRNNKSTKCCCFCLFRGEKWGEMILGEQPLRHNFWCLKGQTKEIFGTKQLSTWSRRNLNQEERVTPNHQMEKNRGKSSPTGKKEISSLQVAKKGILPSGKRVTLFAWDFSCFM